AWPEEIDDCLVEGNTLLELVSPVEVVRLDGRVSALRCVRNTLGTPGADGRPRPEPVAQSEHNIPADLIIAAIGQEPAYDSMVIQGLDLGRRGEILVRDDTGETSIRHMYSGGDAVRGPSYIIQAVADGHRAAAAIARDLGIDLTTRLTGIINTEPDWNAIYHARTHILPTINPHALAAEERDGFDLVLEGYSPEEALIEARRCMQCDRICDRCVDVCPNRANVPVRIFPRTSAVPRLLASDHGIETDGFDFIEIAQDRQIIHIDELCNECGNCAVFCTHSGEPFREKPVFFLNRTRFESATGNRWFINRYEMIRYHDDMMYCLTRQDRRYTVEIDQIRMTMTRDFNVTDIQAAGAYRRSISLLPVAEMIILWEAMSDHPVTLAK
ncbi:MAG TPA: FAD-dependent oxidoreductase, partial [bacterium]|nr:FAD-dependent oxidoreductase [bacterium]